MVDREQGFDGFHLDHDESRYKKVQPITAVESNAFVIDVQCLLPFKGNLPQRKLVGQTLFLSGFE